MRACYGSQENLTNSKNKQFKLMILTSGVDGNFSTSLFKHSQTASEVSFSILCRVDFPTRKLEAVEVWASPEARNLKWNTN